MRRRAYVSVEVDINDVLSELSDEDILQLRVSLRAERDCQAFNVDPISHAAAPQLREAA